MPSTATIARCEPSHGGLSRFAPSGEIYWSSIVETAITTKEVPVKALGSTTLRTDPAAIDFDMPTNVRLRYIGSTTRSFFATAAITAVAAGNNKLLGFHIAKNGTVIDPAHLDRFVGTGADQGAITTQVMVELSNGDYVEVWVENETDNTNLTLEHCILIAAPVG